MLLMLRSACLLVQPGDCIEMWTGWAFRRNSPIGYIQADALINSLSRMQVLRLHPDLLSQTLWRPPGSGDRQDGQRIGRGPRGAGSHTSVWSCNVQQGHLGRPDPHDAL